MVGAVLTTLDWRVTECCKAKQRRGKTVPQILSLVPALVSFSHFNSTHFESWEKPRALSALPLGQCLSRTLAGCQIKHWFRASSLHPQSSLTAQLHTLTLLARGAAVEVFTLLSTSTLGLITTLGESGRNIKTRSLEMTKHRLPLVLWCSSTGTERQSSHCWLCSQMSWTARTDIFFFSCRVINHESRQCFTNIYSTLCPPVYCVHDLLKCTPSQWSNTSHFYTSCSCLFDASLKRWSVLQPHKTTQMLKIIHSWRVITHN